MRTPEHRVPFEVIQAVALGKRHTVDCPAGCFDEGPLLLVESDGVRCVAVEVVNVRIETGARDRLTVRPR